MTEMTSITDEESDTHAEQKTPAKQVRPLGAGRAEAPANIPATAEWLETDGLGGFASGTAGLIRTRRYHALLLPATNPPTGRVALVNGFEAFVDTPAGTIALSSQLYHPDVVYPDGATRIKKFSADPWPVWAFDLGDGLQIEQETFVPKGGPVTVIIWRAKGAGQNVMLRVRPLVSGRDYHSMHHENGWFRFDAETNGPQVIWRPYDGLPRIVNLTNGQYEHKPDWYRNFLYAEERARGLDYTEDLASPGEFRFDLSQGEAVWIVGADLPGASDLLAATDAVALAKKFRSTEQRRRRKFPSRLHRSADDYVVTRGAGKTIVAGYPWFTDWGRDTFIALRGICLATGRLDEARDILLEWAGAVSEGMLPNRFPDRGEQPEFNSVDASLWYVIAVHEYLRATGRDEPKLRDAVLAILAGYARATRFGIRMDADGLLYAGQPGFQLTWMDAKVGDWVVTPRIGKPVEIQALWLNALHIGSQFGPKWKEPFARGLESFRTRFWNGDGRYLYDVVDVDFQPGTVDPSFRPNQIFAVGGLPLCLLDDEKARLVVDAVEEKLWTPLGLRSLAPGEHDYRPRYEGGVWQRDGAYHQGTVWPWLIGAFVEAWVRVRGGTVDAKREARERFIDPILQRLNEAGIGHVPEIADAEPPHTPRGCPFQAWSVGELLRLDQDVLRDV
jgi:predicted glycogen debranching enzyme